jgi:hypothetical protein
MIGLISKPHLRMLAAFLVAAMLPVMAEDSAKGSRGNCPIAAGIDGLRPALAETRAPFYMTRITGPGLTECPTFLVSPKYGAGYNTAASRGRLTRLLHRVTWSWAPTPPYGDPFQIGAILYKAQ